MDKVCPSCGAEVPKVAKRCKDCFHDFVDKPGGGMGWAGPIALLVALAGMVVVANITLLWIVSRPQDQHIQIDQDSRSIVWTHTYVTGTTSDRMLFDEILKLEYVMHASGGYEIAAVDKQGDRKVVVASESPLGSEAQTYSRVIGKELITIDNTRGFGGN